MKKIGLYVCLISAPMINFAAELHQYNDIISALNNGHSLKVITDFTQCNASSKKPLNAKLVGIFSPNEIGFTESYIATSTMHFTLNDPYFPNKPVYEYVRYTITSDNTMKASLHILNASDYSPLRDKISFICKLGEAVKVFSSNN